MTTDRPIRAFPKLALAPDTSADWSLARRLATAPGVVRAGTGRWDGGRTPIMPLAV